MVEALGIIIDRHPKERPRKEGKLNHRKNRMRSYFKFTPFQNPLFTMVSNPL